MLGLDLFYPELGDPRYPVAVAIVLVAWTAANFFSRLAGSYSRQILPSAEGEGDTRMADLVGGAVKYLIWFIAILYLLTYLDISLTPILAGAGIAGIAIALASQDLLSNLFGGVIILLDKPLGVGDKVEDRSLRRDRDAGRPPLDPDPDARRPAGDRAELEDHDEHRGQLLGRHEPVPRSRCR